MKVLSRFIAALSPDAGDVAQHEGYNRMFAASFTGVGLYWAWLFSTSLGSRFTPVYLGVPVELPWHFDVLSFAGYLAALLALLLCNERLRAAAASLPTVCAASGIAALSTLILTLSHALDVNVLHPLVPVALLATGVCTGVFLVAWGMWFARHIAFPAAQIACALIVSGAAFALVACLPPVAYTVAVSLLPVGFGAAYLVSLRAVRKTLDGVSGKAQNPATQPGAASSVSGLRRALDREQSSSGQATAAPAISLRAAFPWHACLALASIGLVNSLLYALAPHIAGSYGAVMPVYAACALLIGVVIALYTACTKRNFAFSFAGAAIVPLAASGLLLFSMFHEAMYVPAFLLIRLAYVLLDALMWLQLSKVLAATGSIRSFLVSRAALSCGELAGVVLFNLTGLTPELSRQLFDGAFVACGILLICVFSLAVVRGGVENAWGLVQPAASRGQRLAEAVEAAAAQYKLTKREREVAALMMRGKSGPYIEEKLCITANTFQTHTRNIYRKLDVHSRAEMEQRIDSFLN